MAGVLGKKKLSKAADRDDTTGTLRCPKCGGTQFEAKRSGRGKAIGVVTLGVGAVLMPKSRVRCVTCGKEFKRG